MNPKLTPIPEYERNKNPKTNYQIKTSKNVKSANQTKHKNKQTTKPIHEAKKHARNSKQESEQKMHTGTKIKLVTCPQKIKSNFKKKIEHKSRP